MAKKFILKFQPVKHFEVGDATFQSIEIEDHQVCLVCVPNLSEPDIEAFKNTWQDIVGDVRLLVCNYAVDLSTFEVTDVESSPKVDKDAPTCLERILADEVLP